MDQVEVRREEAQLLEAISGRRTLMIILAAVLVLLAGVTGWLFYAIGDGQPATVQIPIPKEDFVPYSKAVPVGTYVQAEVLTLRSAMTRKSWMENQYGSRTGQKYQNYYEAAMPDGSLCMLVFTGLEDRLEEFIPRADERWYASVEQAEGLDPVRVYGKTILMYPPDSADEKVLNGLEGLYPFKPANIGNAAYYRMLCEYPVIDLEQTETFDTVVDEESARRIEQLKRWRSVLFVAAGAVGILCVCTGLDMAGKRRRFQQILREQREAAH